MGPKNDEATRAVATQDETKRALMALCRNDNALLRLKYYARERIRRYRLNKVYTEADDLLQEVFKKLLSGQRTWPKDISIEQCVYGAIMSESHHLYTKEKAFNKGVRLETQSLQETLADDRGPSSEALAVTVKSAERHVADRDHVEAIAAALADDEEALRVLAAYVELGGAGAKGELGITQNQLETVMLRIRRKLRRKGLEYGF